MLAEPVYPADSPARSTHSASRANSTSGDLGSLGKPHFFPLMPRRRMHTV